MTEKSTVLPDKQPAIRVAAMPADTNSAGTIFGGWIMSQVDIAGSIAALERARGRVVTVAVNSFEFHQPVFVGDFVDKRVTKIGVDHCRDQVLQIRRRAEAIRHRCAV